MTKKEKELIDAICRSNGIAMTPVEELALLGFYESSRVAKAKKNSNSNLEVGGEFTALNEVWERRERRMNTTLKDWNKIEEYDFDENAEEYKELVEILKMNNNRRKYFA